MKKSASHPVILTIILTIVFMVKIAKSQDENNINFNPIIPDNIADPSLVMFDSVFYLYATTDIDRGLDKMGIPVVWKSRDFVNWSFEGSIIPDIDWDKPYQFKNVKGEEKTGYYRYWAPGKVIKREGKYFIFPTIVSPDTKEYTYVMAADNPEGPFHFLNGDGLFFNQIPEGKKQTQYLIDDIDGEPFIDDDGTAYIYWRRRNASILSKNFETLIGNPIKISTAYGGYSEGPVLFKRNDLFYYIYTLAGYANYCNAYMISKESPLGPFIEPEGNQVFIHSSLQNKIWGPGHGNVFQIPGKDEFIFLYLEYGEGGTTRQVFANRMQFDEKGNIITIQPDYKGVGYLGPANKKQNMTQNALATASSYKEAKTVITKIFPDPNKLAELRVLSRGGDSVLRIFTYLPENAVDGSNGTRWWAEDSDENPWFMLDLKEMQDISKCEIAFIFPTFGHSWKLEKSTNGETWKEIKKQNNRYIGSPHVIDKIGQARFIKITILEGPPGIWELKLY